MSIFGREWSLCMFIFPRTSLGMIQVTTGGGISPTWVATNNGYKKKTKKTIGLTGFYEATNNGLSTKELDFSYFISSPAMLWTNIFILGICIVTCVSLHINIIINCIRNLEANKEQFESFGMRK